jgi:hypothetical protein
MILWFFTKKTHDVVIRVGSGGLNESVRAFPVHMRSSEMLYLFILNANASSRMSPSAWDLL